MKKIGHRGAKGYVAENTLASISKALELGVDAIEIDVHVCKTGELIVIHDEKINRTTSGKGKVKKLTYSSLQLVESEGYKIPTLEEVLDYCANKCNVHIELKGKGTAIKVANLVEKVVEKGKWKYDQLFISSFVFSRLKKIRKHNPKIKLGAITAKKPNKALRFAVKNNCHSVYILHKKIRPHIVRIAKLKKIRIYAWTVNESKEIQRIKGLEIEGVISDFLDRL